MHKPSLDNEETKEPCEHAWPERGRRIEKIERKLDEILDRLQKITTIMLSSSADDDRSCKPIAVPSPAPPPVLQVAGVAGVGPASEGLAMTQPAFLPMAASSPFLVQGDGKAAPLLVGPPGAVQGNPLVNYQIVNNGVI